MINCVVVFGGENCEHDISIVTGCQVLSKLDEYLYNIIPIYIDKKGLWWTGENLKDLDNYPDRLDKLKRVSFVTGDDFLYIKKGNVFIKKDKIDLAILCLHGVRGEDGSVASVFELSKIPYTSSSLMASSVCMDKSVFKVLMKGLDIHCVDGFDLDKEYFLRNQEKIKDRISDFGLPVILKPARQGSSVGIEICSLENEIITKLTSVFKYDDRVVVEKFIDIQKEVNIALFDNKGTIVFSQTEEPKYSDAILTFSDKYLKNANGFEGISRIMPAQIDNDTYLKIKDISEKIYRVLKIFGVVRFDFIISKDGELFINEVNTIPGSMANYLFDSLTFTELLDLIKSNSVLRFERQSEILTTYASKFLKSGKNFIKK